ncbi:MAG: hypothetical protein HY940_04415 [Gammaproteobacteria bacterium]|nr:hypothetical protein [Gammaproteobacteria bacterium]
MGKTTDIHHDDSGLTPLNNSNVEVFIEEQEAVVTRPVHRNSRKALDKYLEKRRLRDHLTFFDIDEDGEYSEAANQP